MADIRNSSFNDVASMAAAFIVGGSKPANFTGLTSESEQRDHDLSDLLALDHGAPDDAPAPGFTTRSTRALPRDVGDGAQGADKGKKHQSGEQQDLRDDGARGKREGQGADRQGADRQGADMASARNGGGKEGPGKESAGREGASQGGAGKGKGGTSTSAASQANAQARKRGDQMGQAASRNSGSLPGNNVAHNQPSLALGVAGVDASIFGGGPLAAPLIGQSAAGAAPMPGAGLPQAAGAMPAPASTQAAAAIANQYAAAPLHVFASQGPGHVLKRHAAKGAGKDDVGEGADDEAEGSADEMAVGGSRRRRMAQPPITGKQASDSDSGDGDGDGDASDEGYASGEDAAATGAGGRRPRRKREAVASNAMGNAPPFLVGKAEFSDSELDAIPPRELKKWFSELAAQTWKASTDDKAGTIGSYKNMKGILGQLMASLPDSAKQDPRFPDLAEQSRLLERFLDRKTERRVKPDTPNDKNIAGTPSFLSTSDSKLAAAIATGDVFEIVYAIMSVMLGSATENTRQRAIKVRQLNSDQEKVRSAQQLVRNLNQGFKPGADGKTKLKDKGDGTSEADLGTQISDTKKALDDIGWDPKTYAGGKGISKDTSKQELDDLISNMDSKLTSYNNMNSLETNDLTREAQAAQAYLTGMNSILTKENQALNGIATSLSR